MKRCPTCTRTFLDEHLSFCTDDGTPLVDQPQSSSFDPQGVRVSPTPPTTENITNVPPTRPFRPDEMPGGWPPPHSWAQPSSEPLAPAPPPSWNTPATPASAWTPPPPPGGRFAVRKSQENPIAIASLAAGIFSMTIGLCCNLGTVTGPIAIVLGVVALAQLKSNPLQSASKGMAVAGIATGAAGLAINIMLLILGIAFGAWN